MLYPTNFVSGELAHAMPINKQGDYLQTWLL